MKYRLTYMYFARAIITCKPQLNRQNGKPVLCVTVISPACQDTVDIVGTSHNTEVKRWSP